MDNRQINIRLSNESREMLHKISVYVMKKHGYKMAQRDIVAAGIKVIHENMEILDNIESIE